MVNPMLVKAVCAGARSLAGLFLFMSLMVAAGCSNQSASTVAPHPPNYVSTHGPDANTNLDSCMPCHGANFMGIGGAVSCYECHLDGPPFSIHTVTWTDVLTDHLSFADSFSWTTCAASSCHGEDLRGGVNVDEPGPSCFTVEDCHAEGPPPIHPHPYIDAALHGEDSKSQQLYCRNCHGVPLNSFEGGFVANPQILNMPEGNCATSICHPAAQAHPTNWQGTNDITPGYLASHRSINRVAINVSCNLCHKTDGTGSGPFSGAPSCFSSSFTNADGSTTECHSDGPPPHSQ